MMRKKFIKLSLITFIVEVVFFVIAFFCFHYLTDQGFSTIWRAEADKPFVTEVLGDFAVLNIATSFISLLICFIFNDKKQNK